MGKVLAFLFISLPLAFLAAIYYAFVAVTLWGWFAVPLGAPVIGLANMYGLSLIASLPLMGTSILTAEIHNKVAVDEDIDVITRGIIRAFVGALAGTMVLILGWIAHSFM